MGFLSGLIRRPPMTIPKFRAAIVVFLVGFALGLSVFAASRLFVRSILSNDAIAAAEQLATAACRRRAGRAARRPLLRRPLHLLRPRRESRRQRVAGRPGRGPAAVERSDVAGLAEAVGEGGAVVEDALARCRACSGSSESAIKRVAVPVRRTATASSGRSIAEVDQTRRARVAQRAPSASSAW